MSAETLKWKSACLPWWLPSSPPQIWGHVPLPERLESACQAFQQEGLPQGLEAWNQRRGSHSGHRTVPRMPLGPRGLAGRRAGAEAGPGTPSEASTALPANLLRFHCTGEKGPARLCGATVSTRAQA